MATIEQDWAEDVKAGLQRHDPHWMTVSPERAASVIRTEALEEGAPRWQQSAAEKIEKMVQDKLRSGEWRMILWTGTGLDTFVGTPADCDQHVAKGPPD